MATRTRQGDARAGAVAGGRVRRARVAKLSPRGADFIAHFEGVATRLYDDPAGHCTIGVGHLVHHGRCNGTEPDRFRRGITRAEAMELLRQDAAKFAAAVHHAVRVPLAQHQLDALTSFAFNVGAGAFQGSTLLRRLNKGEYDAVPAELMRWTRASGTVLPGLVRRRRAEGQLFSRGDYDPGPGQRLGGGNAGPDAEDARDGAFAHLTPGEHAHLVEWLGHRAIRELTGYSSEMEARAAAAREWLDRRCADLREAIAGSPPQDNARRHRRRRLAALEHPEDLPLGALDYPSAGCTPGEKGHIAEREVYASFKSATEDQKARKLANLAWLVDRRKRVYALGEKEGWDRAERRVRHRCLSVATHHGEAYEQWERRRDDPSAGGDDDARGDDRGPAPRARSLRWLAAHRGLTEVPPGSNTDRRADGIRKAQIDCAGGGSWLIGQPWCGVWCFAALQAAKVPGINFRLASVAFIEDDARAGRRPFRGWTRDRSRVLRGDLVVIGGRGVHVETVREVRPDGSVVTDGGNTSAGRAGSQSNGGGAYMRTRYPSEIWGFALVDYPDA